MIGQVLSHFRITGQLGAGGMGEVYRAEDTKLHREVAIKVLPEAFSRDAERLARFEREARVLASLNHPNIAAIHELEEVEGRQLLVMELVEGEDLAARLRRGAIPVAEARGLALQIVAGLAAAHERGIVHRDLKPSNVQVDARGRVKILDFGLARTQDQGNRAQPEASEAPTASYPLTEAGVVLGTVAYMSPEQARGQAADQRSDIWSFGALLFEMLSGERLFDEPTTTDTLAAVLRAEIDWGRLPEGTPRPLRRLVQHCLQREPRDRLYAVADARFDLVEEITDAEAADAPRRGGRWWGAMGLAATVGAAVVAVVFLLSGSRARGPDVAAPVRFLEIVSGAGIEPTSVYSGVNRGQPRVSPDGSMVVYASGGRLWIRDFDRLAPRPLDVPEDVVDAFWSPDSTALAYVSGSELRRISAQGGPSIVLARVDEFYVGGAWGEGDRIVISLAGRGLFEIPAGGGELAAVLLADSERGDFDFHSPIFLGDGRTLAFVRHPQDLVINTVEIFDGKERQVVYRTPPESQITGIAYDPRSGHLLMSAVEENAGLWALPLDPRSRRPRGEAQLIIPDGLAGSVAADGTLVYVDGLHFEPERLLRVDRTGKPIAELGQALWDLRMPVSSPDGRYVAVRARHRGPADLWVQDLARGTALRITADPEGEFGHAWSGGGKELVYASGYGETAHLLRRRVDGTGPVTSLLEGRVGRPSIPEDGSVIVYQVAGAGVRRGPGDIWALPSGEPDEARAVVATPADEIQPAISPDGRLLAYTSNESGQKEVYLQPFPRGGRVRVSTRGGEVAVWSRDGDELYYVEGSTLMAVAVEADGLGLGAPTPLFSGSVVSSPLVLAGASMFTPGPDRDFLVVQRKLPGTPAVVAIENWTKLLKAD